jgi:hypothetical protein
MGKILPVVFLLMAGQTAWAGKTLHLRGNDFSFSVTEPEGWAIDFYSAAQIANFVMHQKGTTWRKADVVTFARFIRTDERGDLKTLVETESQEFQKRCPFSEVRDVNLEVSGSRDFLAKAFHCTGFRHEIVAFTEVPGFFVTFVLSSDQENRLQAALAPFQELLSSFSFDLESSSDGPSPNRPPHTIP